MDVNHGIMAAEDPEGSGLNVPVVWLVPQVDVSDSQSDGLFGHTREVIQDRNHTANAH